MKKLIPILSLSVLVGCSHTNSQLKANLIPLPELENATVEEAGVAEIKSKNVKKSTTAMNRKGSGKLDKGIASWYGDDFHGKKTATGELFDMYGMTAAHKSLPLNSYAEITNTQNKRTVIVKINDRGPFYDKRVLDLSYSAAKKLGIDESGLSKVEIKTIPPEKALEQLQKQNQPIYLQVGSFKDKKLAESLSKNLKKQYLPEPKISASSHKNATLYKVQLPIKSQNNLDELNSKLARIGITDTRFVAETN